MPVRDLEGQTIAVTGATGFLGSHITEELVERGATVIGVVRSPHKGAFLEGPQVSFRKADLADPDSLRLAFEGVDAVVANAALAAGWQQHTESEFIEANIGGTVNTLNAAADAGVTRVVYISSVAVYRTRLFHSVAEDGQQINPDKPSFDLNRLTTDPMYSRTKAAAEQRAWKLADERGLQLTTLRPGPIYGPRDTKLTARYARWMTSRVRLAPTVRIPHVHGRDVAVAVGGALVNASAIGRAYNLAADAVSVYELLKTWKRLSGEGPVLVPVPVPLGVRFDDQAARRDLGFVPRSLEAGVRDVIAAG